MKKGEWTVDHQCHDGQQKRCGNPDHLTWVSRVDNVHREWERRQSAAPPVHPVNTPEPDETPELSPLVLEQLRELLGDDAVGY